MNECVLHYMTNETLSTDTFVTHQMVLKCSHQNIIAYCNSNKNGLVTNISLYHGIGGVYLMEVDRVLRPGGYWILSGPPIRWKKYWKGWQRTKEDLNAEQTSIESVASSLCWNKLVEQGDIAIWQKPINHLHCKANRKITQNPPLCPAQDPDTAWLVILYPQHYIPDTFL